MCKVKKRTDAQVRPRKSNDIDEMRLVNFYRDLNCANNIADKKVASIGILRIARKIKKGEE